MNKIWNIAVVLGISTLLLFSSISFVVGIEYTETTPGPEPLTEPAPIENMAFDPWPTFTGSTIYHNWTEAVDEIFQCAADHPDITKVVSIGQSWQGRDIWAIKISDNPELEEDEPEVFFNGNHHAREWLTIEINLYSMHFFTDNYGTNSTVTDIVDNRQIWIIPVVNPDGRTIDSVGDDPADHAEQPYGWRKNGRDNNGDEVFDFFDDGVDLNRNYDWLWGSSGQDSDPESYTYGGPYGFSEPETQAIRDFCREHDFVFALNYHTYSQLILYPWGWTYEDTADHDLFVTLAWDLNGVITNTVGSSYDGYIPSQGADLYPTSGGSDDWMYGELGILSFTPEAFPYYDWTGGGPENHPYIQDPWDLFHPSDDAVLPVCQDNIHAFVLLCQIADNPFQVMDHIEISAQDESPIIERGTTGQVTLDLLNNGQRDDDFTITTSSISGWTINAAPATQNILRNQTVQSTLSITVPGAETPGEYMIWINVSSDTNSTCTDSCQITVIVPFSDDVGTLAIDPFVEMGTYPMGLYQIDGTVENFGEFQVPAFDTTCTITRFGGGTNVNLFSDDMESGMTQWVTEDWDGALTNDYWHTVSSQSNSPSNSMFCGPGTNGYSEYSNQFLIMAEPIDLRNAETATLTYWTWYSLQHSTDFCVIEGSVDGGQRWDFINRYTTWEMAWTERTNDLSNYTGYSEVLLRFRFTSDDWDDGNSGFYFDDMSIDAFIPGETVVYGPTALPTTGPLDPQNTESLQWQYDFDQGGTYRVSIETQYGADGNPTNNLLDVIFDIDPNARLPDFAGIGEVFNPGTGNSLEISWLAANDPFSPVTYSLFRFDHEPNEAEVNASSAIWTGTDLSYEDTGLTAGQTYYYIVRAADDLGQEEWNMVILNDTPVILMFFQVQSPLAGYRNLNSDPFETAIQISSSIELSTVGQYQIGGADDHWLSPTYPEAQDMTGTWSFNTWGKSDNDLASGNLYAKVYRQSDDLLLFQTTNDDEDIGLFTDYHDFTWTYGVSGVTLPAGDMFYVELWLDVTVGSGAGQFYETLNPDLTIDASNWAFNAWEDPNGTPTGTWTAAGGNPTGYVEIELIDSTAGGPGVDESVSGYWEQSFTTTGAPSTATLEFDWSVMGVSLTPSLNAQIFIDTNPGAPVNEVWNSGAITGTSGWTSVGPLDVTGSVNAADTYYLKLAFRDTLLRKNDGNDIMGYDNVVVNYSATPPTFTFAYDHQSTPSNIEAALTSLGGGMTYDIDLTGIAPDTWVFVSYPITSTGSPITIFDDILHGDGNTAWDRIMWYDVDDSASHWKSYNKDYGGTQSLTFINNAMGFWIHITSNTGDQLLSTGTGSQPVTTSVTLKAGWNLVGYPSDTPRQADATLPIEVTSIAVYNVSQPYAIEDLPLGSVTMTSGNAYWVYTPVIVQWDIDY